MAKLKAEGTWPCKVLDATAGIDDKRIITVRVNVEITDGPSAGMRGAYEDRIDARSAKYVRKSLEAVGWQGQQLRTLTDDVAAWIAATGGMTTCDVKHLEIKNGKRAGEYWDKINALGRGAKPLREATPDQWADADEALRAVVDDDAPHDDAPHAADYQEGTPF